MREISAFLQGFMALLDITNAFLRNVRTFLQGISVLLQSLSAFPSAVSIFLHRLSAFLRKAKVFRVAARTLPWKRKTFPARARALRAPFSGSSAGLRSRGSLRSRASHRRENLHNLRERPALQVRDHGFPPVERHGRLQFERVRDEFVRLDAQEKFRLGAVPHGALAQDAAERDLFEQDQLLRLLRELAEKNLVRAELDGRFVVVEAQHDLAIIKPAALIATEEVQMDARPVEAL